MTIDVSSMSVEQALSVALKAEKEAADVYTRLHGMVTNFIMKDKLQFLIGEEKKHFQIVQALYEKLFPNREPSEPQKNLMPRLSIALEEENSVIDLLELAMEAEQISEEFYDRLSEEVEDRGAQEILQYLSRIEHGHYSLLKGEYDLCVRDEQYFDRSDFQYDMVHIGP